MTKNIDWSEWILEKNAAAKDDELRKSEYVALEKAQQPPSDPHADTRALLQHLGDLSTQLHGPEHGNHEIITPEQGGFVGQPGDVAIYSDHGDSETNPNHLANRDFDAFQEHMDNQSAAIDHHMSQKGYSIVEENDGSGNGMYYGATLYRKKPSVGSTRSD